MPRTPDRKANLVDIEIGRRVSRFRREAGLTQPKLASMIDVTYQQIQKYEHGINRVSCGRLVQIATALKIDIGLFFEGLPD